MVEPACRAGNKVKRREVLDYVHGFNFSRTGCTCLWTLPGLHFPLPVASLANANAINVYGHIHAVFFLTANSKF
ncbi:conserved hypothetical protein [Ricinus communis]|uniref:Uncharacterized protein n=1 Tax=Ricinus communis TaxID=3988 RepID=B9T4A5_RICCO|nr:conserved hypothetical protein [Ricinus communis]